VRNVKKLLPVCLSILLACFGFVSIALAQSLDNLEVKEVVCPTQVTAGASFTVTVYIENDGPNTVTADYAMVGVTGNPVSSLGGTGVWGPLRKLVNLSVGPYSNSSFTFDIKVPTSLRGKMAAIGVTPISNDKNEPRSGGVCIVYVK
jgi:predicted flavoprotein YhiN